MEADARRQQRIDELCAASLRALTGDASLHLRGRRLWQGTQPLPRFGPHLAPSLEDGDDMASFRGAADGTALRLLLSDAALHARLAPTEPRERWVFELLEQLRVEALVPGQFPGMAANLQHRFDAWSLAFHASGLTETDAGLLLFTLAQVARSRIAGVPVLAATEDLIEATRAGLAPALGPLLVRLRRERFDQAAYALAAQEAARLVAGSLPEEASGAGAAARAGPRFSLWFDFEPAADAPLPLAPGEDSRTLGEGAARYRAFSTAYDRERQAATLVRPALLEEYRARLDAAGADDLATCRQFFLDWGLQLVQEEDGRLVFETLNGGRVIVAGSDRPGLPPAIEPGPTLREVVWGVESEADLALYAQRIRQQPGFVEEGGRIGCTDPNGLAVRLQVTRKRPVEVESAEYNTWSRKGRINAASPAYERATPIEVGHVVFFVKDVAACERFYVDNFGFAASDRYPGRGAFLRCAPEGGHHDLFLLQRPDRHAGINHVAFTVRDIHEVFGGGMHISRCGWETQLGPGRHPVSSAYFWYFKNPAGGLVEYYADEDQLTADWQPREFEPGPTVFAEWAIDGGIDGNTRRQKAAQAPTGKFLTDRK